MEISGKMEEPAILPPLNAEKVVQNISEFLKDSLADSKADGLVLGLSGGLDSTTVAYISAKTVQKDKILGLIMPSKTTTPEDIDDARGIAQELGIETETIAIDELIEPFRNLCVHSKSPHYNRMAAANLKARIRMMILYYHANSLNRLVTGTGNRTELLVGYFTKYGDGGVDILPLGHLYKTEVQNIASYLEVPQKILLKAPTAGLWSGQTDEEELGIQYPLLDQMLYLLSEENLKVDQVAGKLQIPQNEVLRIKGMMKSAEHKLTSPPVPTHPLYPK
jgi:NAD+ synthase